MQPGRLPRALSALAMLYPSIVLPQQHAAEDAIVVSASRTEQRILDAIPHTTVLTRKEIRDSQAIDLPSLLRTEAGFEMAQTGGIGATYSPLSLRGGRGSQLLVLVDGVRVEDLAAGQAALQHILLDSVERVEIVRGNVSSLYGSGAIGGVIHVFTGGSDASGPGAELTLGSRETTRASARYRGSSGDTRFNVSVSRFSTRGFSAIDPAIEPIANPDPDGYRNESVVAGLSHRISPRHELGVSLFDTRGRLDYDGNDPGFAVVDTPSTLHRQWQRLRVGRAWWAFDVTQRWKSRVILGEGTDQQTDTRNDAELSRSRTQSRQLAWENQWQITPEHRLSAGLEQLRQRIGNQGGFAVGERGRTAEVLRFGYLGRLGRHSLQANVRGEDYSDFGEAETFLLGYGFDLTDAWRVTASTGTSFRAPTMNDLYQAFSGNPALRPERAQTDELGVQWASGPHRLRVVFFETEYQDLIDFLPAFPFTASNIGQASVTGTEATYGGTLLGLDVRASLTVQDPVQRDAAGRDVQPLRRAKKFGSVSAHRTLGPWRLGAELTGSGSHRDTHITTFASVQEAGYAIVNLMARYHFDKNLFAALRIEDAFDEHYRYAHGYNTAPLGAFITLGWNP